jgi:Ca-activated chloride channel homolog
MMKKTAMTGVLMVMILLAAIPDVRAGGKTQTDTTLSPYVLINTDDPELDRLPLKSTRAKVYISGVIADVRVTQVYQNRGTRPLEAIYIFPASTRAAVYGVKMTVGERVIEARIREREAARREYQAAKQAGQRASLLEQHRPNLFQMNVANILPGDEIRVELKYTELLVPTNGEYELVYPTVAGPRYVDSAAGDGLPSQDWTANPYLHQGEPAPYGFDVSVTLGAGMPIRDIFCPSHKTRIDYRRQSIATVHLHPDETRGGNRDFILKYRLAGTTVETGLLLYEGKDENYFLLMVQPPRRVARREIPPREYIFIVDVSGSMHGFPLDISKKLLTDLIGDLRPRDRFNVLLFAGGAQMLSERSLPATPVNIRRAIHTIENQRGGGGTRLLPALKKALALPGSDGVSRTVVVVTDGYVSVEPETFDLVRNNLGRANLFAFGIGSSVNRLLIEGMARVGMGEPFIITRPGEANQKAQQFRKLIETPVATRLRADFNGFSVYAVEPPCLPDVLADRPVVVFGKWRGRPGGSITLGGVTGAGGFERTVDVSTAKPSMDNAALSVLWARHRVGLLSDYNRLKPDDTAVDEITRLGLSHNLLTAYTSFVAVDTRVNPGGEAVTVKQPLPLPQGVSDRAVGGPMRKQAVSFLGSARRALAPAMSESVAVDTRYASDKKAEPQVLTNAAPVAEIVRISVMGGLNKKDVERQVETLLKKITDCFKRVRCQRSEMVLDLRVDASGRVDFVGMGPNAPDTLTVQCLKRRLGSIRFPVPTGGGSATIRIDFRLPGAMG